MPTKWPSARSGDTYQSFFDLRRDDAAYLFGLLQSDGHVSKDDRRRGRISLELNAGDSAVLDSIAEIVPWSHSTCERTRTTNFGSSHSRVLRIYSLDARLELEALGLCAGPKSSLVRPPQGQFNEAAYIRGLIDGDGTVTFDRHGWPLVGFSTASVALAEWVSSYGLKVTGRRRAARPNRRDGMFNILYRGVSAQQLAAVVYPPGVLAIHRKHQAAVLAAAWVPPIGTRAPYVARAWTPEHDSIVREAISEREAADRTGRTILSVRARRGRLRQVLNYKGTE